MGKKKVIVSPYFQGTSSTTKDLNSQCQRQLIQNKAQLTRTPRGMALDDILKLKLPDYIVKDLDLMFVGINPGIWSAAYGHHYGNPRNHFWPCLFESGLVKQKLTCVNDADCLQFGIGFTNMVDRTTRSSSDLSKNEIREGIDGLLTKITTFKPRIVCFNGKGLQSHHLSFVFIVDILVSVTFKSGLLSIHICRHL